MPFAPPVIVIHDTLLAAVHAQPAALATDTDPMAAGASTDAFTGVIVYVQAGAASWVIVTARPATVSVALRVAPVVFAATE